MRNTFTKISWFVGCLLLSNAGIAQLENYGRLSLDLAGGINKTFEERTPGYFAAEYGSPLHIDAGLRYMFTSGFGVKVGYGREGFKGDKNSASYESSYDRFAVQAVMNIGRVCNFEQWKPGLSLLVHGGPGIGILKGSNANNVEIKDKTGLLMLGFTPVIRLTDKVALTADVTGVFTAKQDHTFDLQSKVTRSGMDSYYGTMSLGLMFNLSKKEKSNIDWRVEGAASPAENNRMDEMEKSMSDMKAKLDSTNQEVDSIRQDLDALKKSGKVNSSGEEAEEEGTNRIKTGSFKKKPKGEAKESDLANLSDEDKLFYTVQLGVYSTPKPPSFWQGMIPLMQTEMPNGTTRYYVGIHHTLEETLVHLNQAKGLGMEDAFATAYFKGERITIEEAGRMIKENGDSILRPKN